MIGIISDIHANVYGLTAALDAIKRSGVDRIICAGDIIGYYPFVNETIELLKKENVQCILGNHDAILLGLLKVESESWEKYNLNFTKTNLASEHLPWLQSLPSSLHLKINETSIEAYHASPWNPLTEYIYPDYKHFDNFAHFETDFIVLGHTHWPFIKKVNQVTIINPGSCGQPRDYQPGACYALLSPNERLVTLHRTPYNLGEVQAKLQELNIDKKLIDILSRIR